METVGDKYMTASGLPERCSNHAQLICSLALDMMEASEDVEIKGIKIKVYYISSELLVLLSDLKLIFFLLLP